MFRIVAPPVTRISGPAKQRQELPSLDEMAMLLAHAARANVRVRVLRTPTVLPCSLPARIGASRSLAWRGSQASIDWKSYSTSGAKPKPTGRKADPRASTESKHSPFLRLLHAHKLWIEELGAKGDVDVILRAVYECYRPLYQSHPALQGVASSLWDACKDPVSVVKRNMRFSVESHNDTLTRLVELQAMEVFLATKRPDLAAAVYYHRKTLAATLKEYNAGPTVDLSIHHRDFKPLAKRALNDLAEYDEVQAVDLHFQAEKPPPPSSKRAEGHSKASRNADGPLTSDPILSRQKQEELEIRKPATRLLEEQRVYEYADREEHDAKSYSTSLSSALKSETSIDAVKNGYVSRSSQKAALRKSIMVAFDHKMLHVEKLASRGEFDAMVRVVFLSYKPLYDTHSALQGVECPLVESSSDADAVVMTMQEEMRPPTTYHERATRRLELKVMGEFFEKKRPDLVVKVYSHRKLMADRVGKVVDEKTGHTTDFSDHDKEFSWHAIRAFKALRDQESVVSVCEDATKAGKTLSPWMMTAYVNALLATNRHDQVRALYADVKSRELPVNERFYGHMLYVASKARDVALMMELRETMKAKGIPLRSEDYLNAVRTFQDKALGVHGEAATHLTDSYYDCANRVANNTVPSEVVDACRQVLALFDEMIEVAKLKPHDKMFTVHYVRAAALVGDFHRVPKYVELADRVFGTPLPVGFMLVDVVNAFLVQEEPTAAWEFVIKASDADNTGGDVYAMVPSNKILASFTSILQYLGTRHDVDLTRQFLDALKAKGLLRLFKRDQHHSLIDAVVLDQVHVSDSMILDMLDRYPHAFRIDNKPASLKAFADACVASGRWSLLRQVLKTKNHKRMSWISDSLAQRIKNVAVEDVSSRELKELVAEMARLELVSDEDREVLSANAPPVGDTLGTSPGLTKTEESTVPDPSVPQETLNTWGAAWSNVREMFAWTKK